MRVSSWTYTGIAASIVLIALGIGTLVTGLAAPAIEICEVMRAPA